MGNIVGYTIIGRENFSIFFIHYNILFLFFSHNNQILIIVKSRKRTCEKAKLQQSWVFYASNFWFGTLSLHDWRVQLTILRLGNFTLSHIEASIRGWVRVHAMSRKEYPTRVVIILISCGTSIRASNFAEIECD